MVWFFERRRLLSSLLSRLGPCQGEKIFTTPIFHAQIYKVTSGIVGRVQIRARKSQQKRNSSNRQEISFIMLPLGWGIRFCCDLHGQVWAHGTLALYFVGETSR